MASLSLFYYYYFGHFSEELAACIPPPMARPRSTRQASLAHNYCVELFNARIGHFSDGFFPSTSHLWNSLPSSVFWLPSTFLPSKGSSFTTLGTRWQDFFYYLFWIFHILSLFFSLLFFPFPKGCRFEKGHIEPILCSLTYIYIYICVCVCVCVCV